MAETRDERPMRPRLRLALVGPVVPFRGGIAHYTTALHRELAPLCDLQTVSFRRQYPAWLYPGKSDLEPADQRQIEPSVDYILDALNPLTWITAARRIAKRGCDLAIVDWWTLYWAPGFALIASILARRRVPTLFICHNLFDHDSKAWQRKLAAALLASADAYLVHANAQAGLLRQIAPGKTVLVHPHPTFDRFPAAVTQPRQRGRLELLFFGFIRPYKGLDTVVRALARLADPDVYLTVVGEPWCAASKLRSDVLSMGAPNVELHLEYVSESDVAGYFARSDLLVLPYRSATGSGVAALAYHYDRPVLATRVGGLPDIVVEGQTGFLVDPDSPEQLAESLRKITRDQLADMRKHVNEYKSRFTWRSLAETLISFAGANAGKEPIGQECPRILS